MYATAIVGGKVLGFRLPVALAKAHKRNAGKTMTDQQTVEFVESKRRSLALRRAKPYLESHYRILLRLSYAMRQSSTASRPPCPAVSCSITKYLSPACAAWAKTAL